MATKKNVQKKADEVKEVTLFENERKEEVSVPAEEAPKKKSANKVTGKKPVEKSVKKVAKKKPAPAKDETPIDNEEAKKEEVSARDKMFPVNLTLEDGTVLTRWDVKSWGALKEGFEKAQQTEGSIFVAVNYPKKKYRKDYITSYTVNMPKEGFPNNLDLMEVMFLQQTIDRLVGLSIYTEALGLVYAEEVESRTKEGWFDLNGAETEIYFASKETK